MDLITYVPLKEAVERTGLDERVLKRAAETGRIRAVQLDGDSGGIAVSEKDMRILAIGEDEALKGETIRVTEAAEKYGVNQQTLTRWADAGYITIIERGPKLLVLDEADVKQVATIYRRALAETDSPRSAGWVLKRTMEYLREQ